MAGHAEKCAVIRFVICLGERDNSAQFHSRLFIDNKENVNNCYIALSFCKCGYTSSILTIEAFVMHVKTTFTP